MQPPPPLLDVLGARWTQEAAVTALAWDGDHAAFALGSGGVAFATAAWPDPPRLRERTGGGLELLPGGAAPDAVHQLVHRGACVALATDSAGGFLSAGTDGRVKRALPDGTGKPERIIRFEDQPVAAIASGRGARRAVAVDDTVHLLGRDQRVVTLPGPVHALAYDPAGLTLAIGHAGGVTLCISGVTRLRPLPAEGAALGVAWSPDGTLVAAAIHGGAARVWQATDGRELPLAETAEAGGQVAFTADGAWLVAAGGARPRCWRLPPSPTRPPVATGPDSRARVVRIACHPMRPLVAAGYDSGAVMLSQPGVPGGLLVRGSGGAAVTALGFHPAGAALAIGTHDGEAALLVLPDGLFRSGATGAPQQAVA